VKIGLGRVVATGDIFLGGAIARRLLTVAVSEDTAASEQQPPNMTKTVVTS
jgi:hypothetical protein